MDEFEHVFIQTARNEDESDVEYKFIIEFSMHCFTRGFDKRNGETLDDVDAALHYSDSRETRIFDFLRHELSEKLPDIARSVNKQACYHTGKGNFFTFELLDENDEVQHYEVYFRVSKAKKGILRLFVESAYIQDNPIKKPKINFFVIAHNTLTNKPIKPPK